MPHQAFRLGSALGLQYHLEMTEGLICEWMRGEKKFLREKIQRDTTGYLAASNTLCRGFAADFLARKPHHL